MKTSITRTLLATTLSSAIIFSAPLARAIEKPSSAPAPKAQEDKAVPQFGNGDAPHGAKFMHGRKATFIIKKMDTDGDGKVTRKEYDTFQNTRFKDTDVNNDGAVTVEEIEAYEEKEREKRLEAMQKGTQESMKAGDVPPPPPHGEAGHDAPPPPPPPPADAHQPKDQPKH
jgi:hypothetical protein